MNHLRAYQIDDLNRILGNHGNSGLDAGSAVQAERGFLPSLDFLEFQSKTGSLFYYMIDCVTMQLPVLSRSAELMTGYSWSEWKKSGPQFNIDNIHIDDRDLVRKVLEVKNEWFEALPTHLKLCAEFTFTFRLRRQDQKIMQILHKGYFVKIDEDERPLLVLGVCYDITPYKGDSRIKLTMRAIDATLDKPLFREQAFYPPHPSLQLTGRHLEILSHIQSGNTTRQIADILSISEETVKGHRKKMLRKSGCRTMNELMSKARQQGVLGGLAI